LINEIKNLNPKEKEIISLYIRYISEIYNLNIIYRGVKNNIDRNLLLQFLVNTSLFLNTSKLLFLIDQSNIEDFISSLYQILSKITELRVGFSNFKIDKNHLIWSVDSLYSDYFFKKFQIRGDNIDSLAIFKIIEVLIKKDKEIHQFILPKIVSIINKKYKILE